MSFAGPHAEEDTNYAQLFDVAFGPEMSNAQVQWRKMPVSRYEQHSVYLDRLGGLDDGVKVWLNGGVVRVNNTARPILAEPDCVDVTLNQGVNTLLLKVTQNTMP